MTLETRIIYVRACIDIVAGTHTHAKCSHSHPGSQTQVPKMSHVYIYLVVARLDDVSASVSPDQNDRRQPTRTHNALTDLNSTRRP